MQNVAAAVTSVPWLAASRSAIDGMHRMLNTDGSIEVSLFIASVSFVGRPVVDRATSAPPASAAYAASGASPVGVAACETGAPAPVCGAPSLISRAVAFTAATALAGFVRLRKTSESTTRSPCVSRTNTLNPVPAVTTATVREFPHLPGLAAEMTRAFFAPAPVPSFTLSFAGVSPASLIRTIQATAPPCWKYCSTA